MKNKPLKEVLDDGWKYLWVFFAGGAFMLLILSPSPKEVRKARTVERDES